MAALGTYLPLILILLPLIREALERSLPLLEKLAEKTKTEVDDDAVTFLQYVCILLDGVIGILPKLKFGGRGAV